MQKSEIRPLTVHDYRELPEGPPYYQLIEGDLYMAPSPDAFHQDILGNIYFMLRKYLEKQRLGVIRMSPSDVQLTDLNVYQPDIYFVSNARKSVLSPRGVEGAPDLVVEVLSPKTGRLDRGAKRTVYARTGVKELWIVDPEKNEVSVYRFAKSADTPVGVFGGRRTFESPLFPDLKIQIAKFFET